MANITKNVSSPCLPARPPGGEVTGPSHQVFTLHRAAKQWLVACPALLSSLGVPYTLGWLLQHPSQGGRVGGGLQPHCCWVEVV